MEKFDRLVGEQLKTMDRLLELQSAVEGCREKERLCLQKEDKTVLIAVQQELAAAKEELNAIQATFEKQTEELILSYQSPEK
ncbi:hypothetical protein LRR81_19245 [Metabacillus sp. GX 13764]|uniref:YgaB family protein n=1 Tax=Metabacillus kandeliae TaxID=2900151 RepID=UPI001E645E30|nr:YgaB family protein [Metabacillus kandeliae]MCD7036386.1 hypothetical protein [Metabacillus kandeliae]